MKPKQYQILRHLPIFVEELYIASYKTLHRKIEGDPQKWRVTPCSWVRRPSKVKKSTFPQMYDPLKSQSKSQQMFLYKLTI